MVIPRLNLCLIDAELLSFWLVVGRWVQELSEPKGTLVQMLTRTRITNPEMTDSAVVALVLGEMQSRGLIKLNPDEDKEPNEGEPRAMWSVEETLCL